MVSIQASPRAYGLTLTWVYVCGTQVSYEDDVHVGRIRQDVSRKDKKGLDIFVCGDQIRKGAAQNAVQCAELLL